MTFKIKRKRKWERIAGGYEVNSETGKVRATGKYGKFGKVHEEALARQKKKLS